ncbi:MAG: tetratricopeptide repeat protein, partial [Desulfobacterales bacterium]|nr:tetratricopeptide repeat protein [Desulfobacterales bacterium]
MKKNLGFLGCVTFFSMLICLGSMSGCSFLGFGSRDDYGGLSTPRVKSAFRKQIARSQEETTAFKKLPEMTSDDYENSGDMYFGNGEFYMAYVQYEKALDLKPDNVRVMYKKGILFLFTDKYEDAAKEFQVLIKKAPDYASAYEGLGQALFQMRKYNEAENSLMKAVELDPKL